MIGTLSILMRPPHQPENYTGKEKNLKPIKLLPASILACMLLAAITGLVLWGRNKGFCITDEAFYLLVSSDPERYNCIVTKFGFLLKKLPMLAPSELVNGRLWQLILQITGASILSIGFLKNVAKNCSLSRSTQLLFWALSAAGSLLIFSVFPLFASYNTLTATATYSAVGCCLYAWSQERKGRSIAYLLCGAFAGLSVFVKVTSAFALFLLLFVCIMSKEKGRALAISLVAYSVGIVLSALLYFLFVEPFATCIESFLQASMFFKQTNLYTPELVINKYFASIFNLVFHAVLSIALIGLLSVVSNFAVQKSCKNKEKAASLLPYIVGASTLTVFYFAGYLAVSTASVEAFYVMPLLLTGSAIGLHQKRKFGKALFISNLPLIILSVIPMVCSLGTNNDVINHTKVFVAPLILAGLYLSLKISERLRSNTPFLITSALFLVVIGWQFAVGFINTPYGIPLPLYQQKETSRAPNLQHIKQAHGPRAFFDAYFALLEKAGFKKGDIILAAYNMPGLVYAADGRSVKFATFLPGQEGKGMFEAALFVLRNEGPQQFFVVTNYEGDKNLEESFSTAGYRFPSDFQEVGSLTCPYDAPYVDIRTGKADMTDLHNRIAIFKYERK